MIVPSTHIIHVELETGEKVTVRTSRLPDARPGQRILVSVPRSDVHLFTTGDGKAISHGV